jgi:CRISPR-associated protein (TIGR03984 family)
MGGAESGGLTAVELRVRAAGGIPVRDALRMSAPHLLAAGPALALLTTPQRCHLVQLDGEGQASSPDGTPDPAAVFEARAFSPAGELRWVHDGGGLGRAHLVSERDLRGIELGEAGRSRPAWARVNRYLLWGERVRPGPPGWWLHHEARVRGFWVPYRREPTDVHGWLHAKEYLGTAGGQPAAEDDDGDGNLAVIEELLVGISDRESWEA